MNATERFIELGDLRFHIREWGSASQPPLVLLHGLASTSHMFDLIAPALAEQYHVIAPDQRGHGLSEQPDTGYDFESIARDLDRLLDALGIAGVVLFGHSWGAYTVVYYAAARPERVTQAGLIDGGLRPLSDVYPRWDVAEVAMSPPEYRNRSLADIERMIREEWLGAAFRPELLPLALSVFDASDPGDVRARLRRDHHMQIAHAIWAMRPADYFARVRCPLLIVNAGASGADPQMDSYLRDAERLITQVRVVWMPETIHDIPWHRPDDLAAAMIRFLNETGAS